MVDASQPTLINIHIKKGIFKIIYFVQTKSFESWTQFSELFGSLFTHFLECAIHLLEIYQNCLFLLLKLQFYKNKINV